MAQDASPPDAPLVKVICKRGSAQAHAIRDFLHRCGIPFESVELHTDGEAQATGVESIHDARLPVCIFSDDTRMECPTVRQIVEKLGWFAKPSRTGYDLAIYGAGPAGLSAAVYGASDGLRTVLVERWAIGGQAGSTSCIENYLGFPDGISGVDLLRAGARPSGCPLDRDPYPLETSAPGIFAAGDVRHGCVKRCASAVGDGAMAIAFVHRYLAHG